MTKEVLIYKRTHTGDPDFRGVFGVNTCMGSVRDWEFDAVIGIGGKQPWSEDKEIAGKVNYIGLGVEKNQKNPDDNHYLIEFKKFILFDGNGELVEDVAPNLYKYMYKDANVRLVKSSSLPKLIQDEINNLLKLAEDAPPSKGLGLHFEESEYLSAIPITDDESQVLCKNKGCSK